MIAPPSEWEGCNGTINSIVQLLNVPQGSRRIVRDVVAEVYKAYSLNRATGRTGGHGGKRKKTVEQVDQWWFQGVQEIRQANIELSVQRAKKAKLGKLGTQPDT